MTVIWPAGRAGGRARISAGWGASGGYRDAGSDRLFLDCLDALESAQHHVDQKECPASPRCSPIPGPLVPSRRGRGRRPGPPCTSNPLPGDLVDGPRPRERGGALPFSLDGSSSASASGKMTMSNESKKEVTVVTRTRYAVRRTRMRAHIPAPVVREGELAAAFCLRAGAALVLPSRRGRSPAKTPPRAVRVPACCSLVPCCCAGLLLGDSVRVSSTSTLLVPRCTRTHDS
jgi:hypothetical protein